MAYQRAGFHVTGVDIVPQPRYAGDHFFQADVMEMGLDVLLRELGPFDAIHASPPCQLFTSLQRATKAARIDLITPLRPLLMAAGLPYIIENVPGAPLINPILLCGTMFGLRVRRHRLFELHPQPGALALLPPCSCRGRVANGELIGHRVAGRVAPGRMMPPRYTESERRDAIGVEWMTSRGARQAIPPAYTEWIGRRLLNLEEPMPSKPPRQRKTGVGVAPKIRRNPNTEPPEQHRCQVCGQMRPDCVRPIYPPDPARWTCRLCLESCGQLPLPD